MQCAIAQTWGGGDFILARGVGGSGSGRGSSGLFGHALVSRATGHDRGRKSIGQSKVFIDYLGASRAHNLLVMGLFGSGEG
jgi:hypothetical protein